MSEPIDLRPIELVAALDLYKQIRDTGQLYIVGHDVAKRKEISRELNVPEIELEFEDAVAILCGFFDLLKPRATPELLKQANVQIARYVK